MGKMCMLSSKKAGKVLKTKRATTYLSDHLVLLKAICWSKAILSIKKACIEKNLPMIDFKKIYFISYILIPVQECLVHQKIPRHSKYTR